MSNDGTGHQLQGTEFHSSTTGSGKKLKVYIPVMSYTSKSFSTSTMFHYLMKINPHLWLYLSQLNGYEGIFQILTQQFSTVQKALKLASRAQELAPSGIMLVILKPKKHL